MSGPPELNDQVSRWIEKADHDPRNAEHVLELEDDCPTDTVCFHCQQCAEKYLKALLVHCGIAFPRTHDLVVLRNLAEGIPGFMLPAEHVQSLNRYSVEGRCPGDWDPIDREEASEALKMARTVRDAARGLLQKPL